MPTEPAPTFSEALIPLSVPEFRGNEWRYLKECLETGWVSSAGPFVERFERAVAEYTGVPHSVAVVNGTAGLHLALRVVGVKPEDEVLVSDLTFIAPVNAIRYCQAHPILVDAHPGTWQMDIDKVERFLSTECRVRDGGCYNTRTGRRVRAIVPVHLLGLACEMDRVVEVARRYHLRVVEDAAQAMGVRYRGRHAGTFGDIGVLSFNGNKIMTTGGGGMLLTSRSAYAESARYLTSQARDDALEYVHHEVGYNYRLTNLQAAVGLAQLEQLDGFLIKKRAIAQAYADSFRGIPGMTPMPTPPHTDPTYWLYTVLLNERTRLEERKAVIAAVREQGIEVRPFWHPIHGLPPYRGCQTVEIEHAYTLYERGISLPSSVGLRLDEVSACADTLIRRVTA